MSEIKSVGCCPKFSPEVWNEKEFKWQEKLFILDSYRSFFHVPLNIGAIIKKNMEKLKQAKVINTDNLILCDEKSAWGANILFAIDNEIPGAKLHKLSGNFISKVFEGPYRNIPEWINKMNAYVSSTNKEIKNLYFWYTTCPKCANLYEKNYVVLIAEV